MQDAGNETAISVVRGTDVETATCGRPEGHNDGLLGCPLVTCPSELPCFGIEPRLNSASSLRQF